MVKAEVETIGEVASGEEVPFRRGAEGLRQRRDSGD
jgi:hypothetical protein